MFKIYDILPVNTILYASMVLKTTIIGWLMMERLSSKRLLSALAVQTMKMYKFEIECVYNCIINNNILLYREENK